MGRGQECYGKMDIDTAISKAKEKLVKAYDPPNKIGTPEFERPWIEAHADSYKSETHRVAIIVREGSPAKGYIVVNYGVGTVAAFDVQDELLYRWKGLARKS